MISMIYLKKGGGTVKIHDTDALNSFVDNSDNCFSEKQIEMNVRNKSRRHSTKKDSRALSTSASISTVSASSKSLTNQSERSQDWLDQKTMKELQNKTNNEYNAAKHLYTQYLEMEETFVKDLDDFLVYKELTDLRRKELLHKKWTDVVYEPIRKRIINALNGPDRYSLDSLRREAHKQFLEHVNKRGFVFLGDDDKEEYYAQVHQPTPVKMKTKTVCDPLHIQKRQRSQEDSTILRCMTGHQYSDSDLEQVRLPPLPLVPQGRHGVNSRVWLEMPHRNIDNLHREKSRIWQDNARTSVDITAWVQQDFDAEVAAQELRMPRKRMFKEQPPFGKPPIQIPHVPFIDPEEFSDKIVNTNPFPKHMTNVKAEAERMREVMQNQQYFEELEQQQLPSQANKQQQLPSQANKQQQLPSQANKQQHILENSQQQQSTETIGSTTVNDKQTTTSTDEN